MDQNGAQDIEPTEDARKSRKGARSPAHRVQDGSSVIDYTLLLKLSIDKVKEDRND